MPSNVSFKVIYFKHLLTSDNTCTAVGPTERHEPDSKAPDTNTAQ